MENMFKKMITEEILSAKLKDLESELKKHVKKEVEPVFRRVDELRNKVILAEENSEKLKNTVSDMETKIEKLETK